MHYRTIYLLFFLTISQVLEAEQGLQRLFITAQERIALEATRSKPPLPPPSKEPPVLPPMPPRYITFNGLVTRSNGPTAAWLNGSNKLPQQGFAVKLDKRNELSVSIILSNSNQTVILKPGQTVDTLDGTVKDNYELLIDDK